jgi:hypothetical protein
MFDSVLKFSKNVYIKAKEKKEENKKISEIIGESQNKDLKKAP